LISKTWRIDVFIAMLLAGGAAVAQWLAVEA
jgi:hypothetical protein